MQYAKNILETIGNTPLVQLNSVTSEVDALVLAKVETFNPGNSIKDRMALKMVEDAEADGRLKPGGTIIEGTSGNTGMGLALAAIIKGYKCIFVISDKQSKEKMDILRAVGAEVVVCPTNVEPDDPRSYYSVSKRLGAETPNSWYVNQYDNPSNALAHYEQTGPEIWKQTEGKITHFVVGVGTGGTVSGTAKYLKEQNPNIKVWGIDTYGSVFKKYHETGIFDENEIYPYITEGIGEDILPKNVDFSLIDGFTKVTDKDAAVYTRKIAKEEGIFVGNSAGSAVKGILQLKEHFTKDDVVVVLFHDHGSRYIGKIYNDDWMKERGWLEVDLTVKNLINGKHSDNFISIDRTEKARAVLTLMKEHDLSQLPVVEGDEVHGSITQSALLEFILSNPMKNSNKAISEIMGNAFPIVDADMSVKELNKYISKSNPAVITKDESGKMHIITQYDIIQAL